MVVNKIVVKTGFDNKEVEKLVNALVYSVDYHYYTELNISGDRNKFVEVKKINNKYLWLLLQSEINVLHSLIYLLSNGNE